jgi:RNA polymerase sigma factor (sigma-70 family)
VDRVSLDDLVQEVFLVVHRRRAEVPADPAHAKRWLLEATKNHAANWRRLSRHKYEELDMQAVANAFAKPEDPEAHAALRDLVCRALYTLDPPDRELLARHHLGGESFTELAAQLRASRSTAHLRCRSIEARMRRNVLRRDAWPRPRTPPRTRPTSPDPS